MDPAIGVSNRCRICLIVDATVLAQPISRIREKLLFVAGVTVHSEQPQTVCQYCVDELEGAYKFKRKCEEAEKKLLQEKVKLELALQDFANISAVENFFNEVTEHDIKLEEEDENLLNIEPVEPKESSTKTRNIQCEICQNFYLNFSSLKSHYFKSHNNVKPYNCSQCNKQFHIKAQVEEHKRKCFKYRQHSKPQPKNPEKNNFAACAICNNAYDVKYLPKHLLDVHCKQSKEFECDLCGEKYKAKAGLVEHMKRRHMKSQFACSYCELIFPTSNKKRIHQVRYHTFEYSNRCNVCDLKFVSATEYRRHVTIHTGETNFECSVCGKKFARKQSECSYSFTCN